MISIFVFDICDLTLKLKSDVLNFNTETTVYRLKFLEMALFALRIFSQGVIIIKKNKFVHS